MKFKKLLILPILTLIFSTINVLPAFAVDPGQGDSSFNANFPKPPLNGQVSAAAVTSDGTVLLGGSFTGKLLKFNSDGTRSGSATTFNSNIGSSLNGEVKAISIFSNGQIVVGGDFTGYLKMFNPDGTTTGTAATFNSNVNGLLDDGVEGLVVKSDDFILVGGIFDKKIKMLNANGSISGAAESFNTNVGRALDPVQSPYNWVRPMVVTADGSIIVGGGFTNSLKKFNADGTTNGAAGSFNSAVGSSLGAIRAIALDEANGALTVGGQITNYVKRLNLDGTTTGATTTSFNAAMTTRNF